MEVMRETYNYIVDYIIAKRIGLNGKIEYLVKWEGWGVRHSTWETADQFASHQTVDSFEIGIKSQLASNDCKQTDNNIKNNNTINNIMINTINKKLNVKQRKERPIKAFKFLEDYTKQHIKNGRTQVFNSMNLINNPIKSLNSCEKLIGAAKRKSRMSCPSSVITNQSECVPIVDTKRSERYKLREQLKDITFNTSSLSIESNESLEENKNPQLMGNKINLYSNNINGEQLNCGKKRKIETNYLNSSKKIAKSDSMSRSVESSPQIKQLNESPTKLFINKVRDRYESKPEIYSQFLNNINEFKNSRIEMKKLLGNEELINQLFDILITNRKTIINRRINSISIKTNEEINEEINKWSQKVDTCLKSEEKKIFWTFLKDKSYDSIFNASPDYLWLRINKLLCDENDLKEEFKKLMTNLCSKPYFDN